MVLVDTSVWADHFRSADERLRDLLNQGQVLTHPFVIGELALGNLRDRRETLAALLALPSVVPAENGEVLALIDGQRLFGRGVGLIDVHLLASTRLTAGSTLWTRDKRLLSVARELQLAHAAN